VPQSGRGNLVERGTEQHEKLQCRERVPLRGGVHRSACDDHGAPSHDNNDNDDDDDYDDDHDDDRSDNDLRTRSSGWPVS
jgi:hypothetical protein